MDQDWNSSQMKVEDIAPELCKVYGVAASEYRPCLVFRGLLSPKECAEINEGNAEAWEKHKNLKAGPDAIGERSQFAAVDKAMSEKVWARIKPHLPTKVDGGDAIGMREQWNHARYCPGQWIFAHMDGRQTSDEHHADPTIASRMTITIYLDEDYTGAEFVFIKGIRYDGSYDSEHFRPAPKTGDAIIFYQAVEEFAHAVRPLETGSKTIMRSDVLFKFSSEVDADVGGERVKPSDVQKENS